MVDSAAELRPEWFEGKTRVGLTAGASAPEVLVREVIDRLKALGAVSVRTMDGVKETLKFPLPKGLKLDEVAGADASPGAAVAPATPDTPGHA
jgi:4-hydroxy-3-methylbut-2-enyl diphosphate reductase